MGLPNQMTTKASTAAQLQRPLSAAQALSVNSARVRSVMERLLNFPQANQTNFLEFKAHCLSLSRGIDYALANNEQLDSAKDIPSLVKQLCEQHNFAFTQATLMVLLISVKNACLLGWFQEEERQEMLALADKSKRTFCEDAGLRSISGSHPAIMVVIERYFPLIKIRHLVTAFEVKSGFGIYTNDFHILKKTAAPEDRIRLLVAQVDNMDTSGCIVSPQKVSFLVNGRSVEKRTNISMDTGPQMPTNVTHMLKYGTNLLQAAGDFEGSYIIVVSFMYDTPLSDTPVLLDHDQSLVEGLESDPDLIEGPSRISLNCPISYTRIKLPVKGHSCKHRPCFDFRNFVSINSSRPNWRCPHCNQFVNYKDIRVDQNIVKVLKEVGDDVSDVIVSADGSWKAVLENDDRNQSSDVNLDPPGVSSDASESPDLPNIVDLTVDDKDGITMDIDSIVEVEETKPSVSDLCAPSNPNDTTEVSQNITTGVIDEDFWAGLNVPTRDGVSQSAPDGLTSVAPSLNPAEPVSLASSSSPMDLALQQTQFMNQVSSNEYGTFPSITRTVDRLPVAIQALPAQSSGIQAPTTVYTDPERQRQLPRAPPNPPQYPQNHVNADHRRFTNEQLNGYRANHFGGFQNQHLQHSFNPHLTRPLMLAQRAGQSQPSRTAAAISPPVSLSRYRHQADPSPESNRRPDVRMRGDLTERDFSHMRDGMIQPTQQQQQQQSQPPRPALPLPPQFSLPAHLSTIIANHISANAPEPPGTDGQE